MTIPSSVVWGIFSNTIGLLSSEHIGIYALFYIVEKSPSRFTIHSDCIGANGSTGAVPFVGKGQMHEGAENPHLFLLAPSRQPRPRVIDTISSIHPTSIWRDDHLTYSTGCSSSSPFELDVRDTRRMARVGDRQRIKE